jgi:hypothetical protein
VAAAAAVAAAAIKLVLARRACKVVNTFNAG